MRRNSSPSGSSPEPTHSGGGLLSHVFNVSGLASLPLIGARLAARGVPHFHVDGAQSFGALAVDL